MSDHCPVSFHVAPQRKQREYRSIPAWVVAHADFPDEIQQELDYLCDKEKGQDDTTVSPMRKLALFKQAAKNAAIHIRRLCSQSLSACVSHRLACTLQFIKHIRDSNFKEAELLQRKYEKLRQVGLDLSTLTTVLLRLLGPQLRGLRMPGPVVP